MSAGREHVFEQEVPSAYNGFLYPLQREVRVEGTAPHRLSVGQIGWLESGGPTTTVRLIAGEDGARVMLYAGERQNVPIVTHGRLTGASTFLERTLVRAARHCATSKRRCIDCG
jgi:redox-sensitive bicupin YhaK (pirin superfamily)